MDSKVKKWCPNCSQTFSLKSTNPQYKSRLPLLIMCGHTICEVCVRNMIKFTEPIQCKICHCDIEIPAAKKFLLNTNLYDVFPINIYMVGELTLQTMQENDSILTDDKDCYINLKEILTSLDNTKGRCVECQCATTTMCKQCVTNLCENCFLKSHKFHIFKSHVLKSIEAEIVSNFCQIHKEKQLDYFCKDCLKPICMDCMIVGGEKSCKNHNIVSAQEENASFCEKLNEITPKVDETFRRLTKVAVDIGHSLKNIEDGSANSKLNKMKLDIQHYFSKLHAAIQNHEQEIMNSMESLSLTEKQSLMKSKSEVAANIKKSKAVLNKINIVLDPENHNKANVVVIYEEAKEIIDLPWYLTKDEGDEHALKLTVNEDICSLINDYVRLEGNTNPSYKLLSSKDIGEDVELPPAPSKPVFPPELIKDVRELYSKPKVEQQKHKSNEGYMPNVPKYRSKYGSSSSINSVGSDSSHKRSTPGGESYSHKAIVHHVSPLSDSNQPKPLQEGSQELIYISHIISPDNFYVQRACHQDLVKKMLREFRNAHSFSKPNINLACEGKLYLALNKAYREWQRARVITVDRRDVNKALYHMFFIDFGSTEIVTIEELRQMPSARLQSPTPLAINCCLANCKPRGGSWTVDDAVLIQKIIDNKQAVIHVRRVRSLSNFNMIMECDVTTFENGVSLAHALVFHERAKMLNPNLPYPKIMGLVEKPRLFCSNTDYKPKSVEEIIITNAVNPDKFFVRKCHLQSAYENLSEELELDYSRAVPSGTVYYPEIGMVCVVNVDKYTEQVSGGGWRRATVTAVPGRRRTQVFLVDTGETVIVHYTEMRYLQTKFTKLKGLATECHLSGITPLNKKWSTGAVVLLQNYLCRVMELHVEEIGRGRSSVGVILYDKADHNNVVCLNSEMLKHRFAVTIGLFTFNEYKAVEEKVYTNKNPLAKPKAHSKPVGQVKIFNQDRSTNEVVQEDLEAKDKGPIKLEVKVLSCQSPSLVYVSLIDQQKIFKELYDNIHEYYSNNKRPATVDWKVGARCCTMCTESKTWRRAVIIELEEQLAKVFYSDFACIEKVPVSNLQELVPEFTTIGDAAIKCHLSGIMPAAGDEWPSITKEHLLDLVSAYPRIFITKNGAIKDKSLPVELWVYHVIQGGALEPNKAEWRCLNKNIIQQGLAVPDNTQQMDANTTEEDESDDTISFLNYTGSVREMLQLNSPQPPEAHNSSKSTANLRDSGSSSPEPSEDDMQRHESTSNTVFLSDWLPPEPLKNQTFTGIPTYIDNNGIVYLHDITQQDTLDMIRRTLDFSMKDPDPKVKYNKWVVGQPCIARFYLDKRFYRGRIVEINEEKSTCSIHYIDYGNEEECAFSDLRKTIVLYQIPIQAHKCTLSGIKPIEGTWDKTTLDYIHKSVVEKQCFIKVTGDTIGDIVPIELKVDKFLINDLIVDLKMAVYTDGSKPRVPKFVPNKVTVSEELLESDSGPDYIVEDDESVEPQNGTMQSNNSFDVKSLDNKDWNALLDEDEELNDDFIAYPKVDVTDKFLCDVVIVHDSKVELSIVHDDETNLLYEEMFANLQESGDTAPPINGVYENKACIALFHEDGQWYRSLILQHSTTKGLVKVKYVDFGNTDVISLADLRETCEKWAKLPPAVISAKLYNVEVNPDVEMCLIMDEYEKTFMQKGPFQAKIIKIEENMLCVELCNDDGSLVYENLIENGIFIRKEKSTVK